MAGGTVGRLNVRVLPDSSRFRDDLKKTLDRVEKSVVATIKANVELARGTVRKAQEEAQKQSKSRPAEIPAVIGDIDKRFISRMKSQAQKAANAAEAAIPASIDGEGMRAGLKKQIETLEKTLKAQVPVDPEKAASWRRDIQKMVDEIEKHTAKVETTIQADVDSGVAATRLSQLARPRIAEIIPKVNGAALAAAATALAALSGARLLGDAGRGLKRFLTNIDRITAKVGALAPLLTNLAAGGIAGFSNLAALAGSLASIGPALLALPGILVGAGIGFGVLAAALADTATVLGDLGPRFSALQDTISSNFWAVAEGPIRNLVDTLLPRLEAGLGRIATSLGGFTGALADALATPANAAALDGIMASVAESIDIASQGIGDFISGLTGLVGIGAGYLPQLAGWFNDISASFNSWVQQNTANGNLFAWVDAGVAALQDLGRVIANASGVLGGFATAAANAGGANLGALADGLERMNAAVNGPIWQGALETVFRGAHDAMKALGPGVAALGDAFVSLAPTLAQVFTLAGQIGSVALTAISDAFQNPAFQGGLVAFFEGVLAGIQGIAPAMPAIATAFGALASTLGTVAAVLGPVLGAAFEALAPVVTDLAAGLSAIVPVIGGALLSAITFLAPIIQQVVSAITDWVVGNPQLATTILAVATVIGGLVAGAVALISALVPIISTVVGLVAGFAGLGVTTAGVSAAFAAAAPVIAVVAAALAAIVAVVTAVGAALLYAWTTSEQFRTAVQGLGAAIMGFLAPIIAYITGTVVPVLQQMFTAFIGMMTQIGDALAPLMAVVIEIATVIIERLTPIVSFLLSILAPAFRAAGTIISAAMTFIGTVVSNAIDVITAVLNVVLALLKGDWAGAWQAAKNVVSTVMAGVRSNVAAGMAFVRTVVSTALNSVKAIFSTVLAAVIGFVRSRIAAMRSAFSSGLAAVRAAVSSAMAAVQSRFRSAMQAVASAVQSGISRVLGFFRSLPGRIVGALGSIASRLYSVGTQMMQGMINGVKAMAGRVASAAGDVVSGAVSRAKSVLGIHSPSRVFMEIGEYTGDGMVKGLEHRTTAVNSAMSSLVQPPRLPSIAAARSAEGQNAGVIDHESIVADLMAALSQANLIVTDQAAAGITARGERILASNGRRR